MPSFSSKVHEMFLLFWILDFDYLKYVLDCNLSMTILYHSWVFVAIKTLKYTIALHGLVNCQSLKEFWVQGTTM